MSFISRSRIIVTQRNSFYNYHYMKRKMSSNLSDFSLVNLKGILLK
jgi:hypothetical protein